MYSSIQQNCATSIVTPALGGCTVSKSPAKCGHGGIGRRARFRFLFSFRRCRFKSCCPHQQKTTSFVFFLLRQRTCDNFSIVGKQCLQPALVQLTRLAHTAQQSLLRSFLSLQVLSSVPKKPLNSRCLAAFSFFAKKNCLSFATKQ